MAHQPYTTWMQTVLDGPLAPDARQQLEAHLAVCPRCQSVWDGLSTVDRLFRAEPMLAPRPGFSQRFNARLEQRRTRPRLIWGGLALGLGAVGVSALVVPMGLGLILSLFQAAQQPATALAFVSSWSAASGMLDTALTAAYFAGRAVFNGLVSHPLTWAVSALALALTVVWLYVMRKITPQGIAR